MGLNLDYTDGRTPIDEDEKEGKTPKTKLDFEEKVG